MTYRDLLEKLKTLDDKKLNQTVTVCVPDWMHRDLDEYHSISRCAFNDNVIDALDAGNNFLVIK